MAVTIAENMNNRKSHSLLVEMQNGTVTLGYSVTVSYTTKRGFHYNPAITLVVL